MTNRTIFLPACLAVLLVALCVPSFAAAAGAPDRPVGEPALAPPRDRPGPPREGHRFRSFAERFRGKTPGTEEELAELIEVVGAWRMMKEAGLSEEQTLKMLKLGREMREQGGKIGKQRGRVLRELKQLLDDPNADDDAIAKQLQNLDRLDERHFNLIREYEQKMRSGLTVRQQAKLRLFRTRFERDMRRLIEHVRQEHAAGVRGKSWNGKRLAPGHPPEAAPKPPPPGPGPTE